MSYLSRAQCAGRVLAADAALLITEADGSNGTIVLNSTTGTKAATFSWATDVDTAGGAKFDLFLAIRSGGAYTVACTYLGVAGTVTLDAALETPRFHRIGSTLHCIGLGGATFA